MTLHGFLTRWSIALVAFVVFLLLGLPIPVSPQTAEGPAQEGASLSLSPSEGPPGTRVSARGSGYEECGSVTLSWDDGTDLATDDDVDDGGISVTFIVPEETTTEAHTVTTSCGGADAIFTVEAPSPGPAEPPDSPPPSPPSPSPLPPPSPSPLPPPSPSPPAPAPPPLRSTLAELENIINSELESGVILYNPPERMRVDERVRVEVRISRAFSDEIRQGLRGRGAPRVEELLVGTFMKVELKGDAFDITPIGSDIQPLLATGFAEWRWDVRPTVSGVHPLYLIVAAVHEGTTLPQAPPFERRINVAVNPIYWLKSNWEKLLGTLIGIVGLIETYRRLRHKRNSK
jgi:hypothetical protein